MARRRPGSLLRFEVSVLAACLDAGESGSHGFALAKAIADAGDSRQLTATGTLYRSLHRLDEAGLVQSWWEDPNDAADAGRPRRRSYRVTAAGAAALAKAQAQAGARTMAARVDPRFLT
jgi:PadR family transcriptional regulator PadR